MRNGTASVASLVVAVTLAVLSCASQPRERRSSVLGYLYPEGKEAAAPQDVHLELPLVIGLAFVPETRAYGNAFLTPDEQQLLLERVKAAFLDVEEFHRIEVVPASYVSPGGGFENVDQIRRALGIDLIVLVSFDQTQFDDPNLASVTYWTILGAYVVPGNENETHTFLSASAFDVESRALLLIAAGKSVVQGRSTAVGLERSLREDRVEGFHLAIDDLVSNLRAALGRFREQVETGTVRGQGTPAVEVTSAPGYAGGSTGVGSLGALELALAALLAVGFRRRG